ASTARAAPSKRIARRPGQWTSTEEGASGARRIARALVCASAGSSTGATSVREASGTGWSRSATRTIRPSRPAEPQKSFARSYPATFLTTLPPELAIVPSASTTVTPITRSRAAPKRWRSGPDRSAARHAPIVGLPGGSSASRWPAAASRSFRSRIRTPASTIAVRSPASCSSTWSSRAVETTTSPPSRSIETCRPSAAARASSSAAWWTLSTSTSSETLGKARLLEWMRAVRAGHLAAEARRRQQLPRVAEPDRVERAAQPLHRLEVVGAEEERHRADLVDADSVLAGQRAAGLDTGLEDRLRQLPGALRLALDARVVEDERVQVAVAGVEDVPDAQPVLALQVCDPAEHLRQLRPGDDAVLDVVVARDPPHRRERRLAALPEQSPLPVVGGDAELPGAA